LLISADVFRAKSQEQLAAVAAAAALRSRRSSPPPPASPFPLLPLSFSPPFPPPPPAPPLPPPPPSPSPFPLPPSPFPPLSLLSCNSPAFYFPLRCPFKNLLGLRTVKHKSCGSEVSASAKTSNQCSDHADLRRPPNSLPTSRHQRYYVWRGSR
jgi:hypothetical protein